MCLGMAAVPFFLNMVFLQSDCGVPLVTITSSPAGVHRSFDLSPGFGFRPSASITSSGTWVVPPLFRIVSARRKSLAKSARGLLDENGGTVWLRGPSAILRITHSFFSFLSYLDLGFEFSAEKVLGVLKDLHLFQFQSYSCLAQLFFHLSCLPDRFRGEISCRLSDTAKLGLGHYVSDEIALIGLTLDCHVKRFLIDLPFPRSSHEVSDPFWRKARRLQNLASVLQGILYHRFGRFSDPVRQFVVGLRPLSLRD